MASIDLAEPMLRGTIPPELGRLMSLQELYLYRSSLSGTIPAELAAVDELTDLLLFGNRLSGSLPEA